MLIDFTIQNFMSYRDEVSLNMVAATTVKENEGNAGNSNVINTDDNRRILKSAAIYGANGSGKSAIISAMNLFKLMILRSFNNEELTKHLCSFYYRFDKSCENKPVGMQMIFVCDKSRYRYGFEAMHDKITAEWLYVLPAGSKKESYYFKRNGQDIKVNHRHLKGAGGIDTKTRDNALYISTAAQFNVAVAMTVKGWFEAHFNILSGLNNDTLIFTAREFMNDPVMKNRILQMIGLVDTCIKDIDVKEQTNEMKPQDSPVEVLKQFRINIQTDGKRKIVRHELEIRTSHELYDAEHAIGTEFLDFSLESLGTTKLFALLGPFFDTIQNGGVLIMDEFGASLHTQLSIELLKLFHSRLNKSGAQLIVVTHDTNLLRKDLLRRDQIWFAEKSGKGVSDLYSLVEYKINQANSVRNDASFAKDYLLGRYGAIPYFGNIEKLISEYDDEKE